MIEGQASIGWARGDITPPRKTFVMGQFHTRISDEVKSRLTATALAIEVTQDGESDHVVFLSCDLAFEVFKDDMIRELEGRCDGLDPNKVTIACTHTHNAPAMTRGIYDEPENDPDFMDPDEYRLWLAKQAADIIEDAWNSRVPGGISRGFGYAVVGRCRRIVYDDQSARMYGDTNDANFRAFEAIDDHAVNMLYTHDADGALTGILINFACPSQCRESGSFFSADYWHETRQLLADKYGEHVHLLPQVAPAGDASPHLMTDKTEEADLRSRLNVDDCGIIARRIMAAINEGIETASPVESTIAFQHDVDVWQLPRLKVTAEEYELEKRIPGMTDEERAKQHYAFQRIWPFGVVCDLVTRYETQDDNPDQQMESHVIRIGDVAFATNSFELYIDYGLQIRSRSKALQTFLVQLADTMGEPGFYLPTQRAWDGGHYSAQIKSCWVGPEGGQLLVEKTVDAINSLFANEQYATTR